MPSGGTAPGSGNGAGLPALAIGDTVGAERVADHRQRAEGVAVDEHRRRAARLCGQAGDVDQRDEVVGGGHGERPVAVLGQRRHVPRRVVQRAGVVVEKPGPVEGAVGVPPVDAPQVVHDLAAAHDEHAALAQRGEAAADVEVVLQWLEGVDGQLHDRDVSRGKGVGQEAEV